MGNSMPFNPGFDGAPDQVAQGKPRGRPNNRKRKAHDGGDDNAGGNAGDGDGSAPFDPAAAQQVNGDAREYPNYYFRVLC
jgi:hypothetical protein